MTLALCIINLSFNVIQFFCIFKWSQDYDNLYKKYNDLRIENARLKSKVGK